MTPDPYILPDNVRTLDAYRHWVRGISVQDEPPPEEQRKINERIRVSKAAKRAADNRQPEPVEITVVSEGCRRGRTGHKH